MAAANGREVMLARLVDYVRSEGLPSDPSLRRLAEAVGTSHRMLAYYFGSREGLLATVLTTMRAQDREALRRTAAEWDLRDAVLAMWSFYTDPQQLPERRAFFYVLSLALEQPQLFAEFLASFDAWVDVTAEIAQAEGLPPQDAARTAQLIVSAVRGLLMDRLASASPERIDAAFSLLLDRLVPTKARVS